MDFGTCSMVLHVPLPYDHGRDSALGVRGPCPRVGGLGGPSPPPGTQGGVGGCKPPTCYRVKVLHGTQPCIPIVGYLSETICFLFKHLFPMISRATPKPFQNLSENRRNFNPKKLRKSLKNTSKHVPKNH